MRLWFKSKNPNKTVETTCPTSDICKTMDCRLADLRSNQVAQKQIKQRITDLENKYFPMVYWWVLICYKIGSRMHFNSKYICRGLIEDGLQMTLDVLKNKDGYLSHEILGDNNFSNFDVDQFCKEMKDYFSTDQQVAELNQELKKLVESEKNLKAILKIE